MPMLSFLYFYCYATIYANLDSRIYLLFKIYNTFLKNNVAKIQ